MKGGFSPFCDLAGRGAGGTLPRDILATAQRPDLVILNGDTKVLN